MSDAKKIEVTKISNEEIKIAGEITSYRDFKEVREAIDDYIDSDSKKLQLHFENARILISSMIGYLIYLQEEQKIDVSLHVREATMYNALERMGLLEHFSVVRL